MVDEDGRPGPERVVLADHAGLDPPPGVDPEPHEVAEARMAERGGPLLVLEPGERERQQERPEEERAERGVRQHDQDVVIRAGASRRHERAEQQRGERQARPNDDA